MVKRPVRIAVVGIDGTGKTSTVDYLKGELERFGRVEVMSLAPRANRIQGKLPKLLVGTLERINRLSDTTGNRLPISISQILMNRLLPVIRLAKECKSDFIIHERHPAVDYPVYGKEYVGKTVSKIERTLSGIPDPDILIYLDAKPETAIERVLRRKNKPPHPHERSVKDLEIARSRFERALGKLEGRGVRVIRINADQPLKPMLAEVKERLVKELSTMHNKQ